MRTPEITLEKAKKEAEKVTEFRASDFLSQEETEELRENNKTKHIRPLYDEIDAYVAEIIARFGYDTYLAWKSGAFEDGKMTRLLEAERARDARARLKLENVIVAANAGSNHPAKGGTLPRTLKIAIQFLKEEKKAGGIN